MSLLFEGFASRIRVDDRANLEGKRYFDLNTLLKHFVREDDGGKTPPGER